MTIFRSQQPNSLVVGRFICGLFVLARLSLAVVEMVDIHVVMVKGPAGGFGFRKIGIAVGRMKPGAADVERDAEMLGRGPGSAADTVHRLQNSEAKARPPQGLGGGKSSRASPDDHDINVFHDLFQPLATLIYLIVGKFFGVRQRSDVSDLPSGSDKLAIEPAGALRGLISGNQENNMAFFAKGKIFAAAASHARLAAGGAQAATCGNKAPASRTGRRSSSRKPAARGIGGKGLQALADARYATKTITADRNQKASSCPWSQFMQARRHDDHLQGQCLKKPNAALFARIEQRYGVSAGPLLAIWGMETGFGGFMGNQNTVSAIVTLAYDCRRPEFFTNQLHAALQLVQSGTLSPSAIGAMHGEIGQTQFLPGECPEIWRRRRRQWLRRRQFKADALASTANFLRGHGWRAGGGYQPARAISARSRAGTPQRLPAGHRHHRRRNRRAVSFRCSRAPGFAPAFGSRASIL